MTSDRRNQSGGADRSQRAATRGGATSTPSQGGGAALLGRSFTLLLFLALGAALGTLHRVRAIEAAAAREPVEHTASILEALVLLREGRDADAAEVLHKRLDHVVRRLRHLPDDWERRTVLEHAESVLARERRARREIAPSAPSDRGGS